MYDSKSISESQTLKLKHFSYGIVELLAFNSVYEIAILFTLYKKCKWKQST